MLFFLYVNLLGHLPPKNYLYPFLMKATHLYIHQGRLTLLYFWREPDDDPSFPTPMDDEMTDVVQHDLSAAASSAIFSQSFVPNDVRGTFVTYQGRNGARTYTYK
jgi:hypothetical protein